VIVEAENPSASGPTNEAIALLKFPVRLVLEASYGFCGKLVKID
jgi:hypothetical protein